MKQFFLRLLALLAVFFAGGFSTSLYAGWFDSDNSIHVVEKANPNAPKIKYAATIRIVGYVDGRNGMSAKFLGVTTERIAGLSGKEMLLSSDVTELVANSIRKRFDGAGFQLVDDANAMYELSGVVKELTYNVKARDEVNILLETTLKETATGKVVWSGLVAEKNERFAGVSGNSKDDIATYLRYELGIATQKTVDAISAMLMATRPDLFNLIPGTKVIAGVTVLQATGASSAVPAIAESNGTLVLGTKPTRSKVYLDGVYFGMSPLRAEVEVGIHEVSVKSDGYKTATEKVSVRKGDTTELELVLER
jgi:hypothetical protein